MNPAHFRVLFFVATTLALHALRQYVVLALALMFVGASALQVAFAQPYHGFLALWWLFNYVCYAAKFAVDAPAVGYGAALVVGMCVVFLEFVVSLSHDRRAVALIAAVYWLCLVPLIKDQLFLYRPLSHLALRLAAFAFCHVGTNTHDASLALMMRTCWCLTVHCYAIPPIVCAKTCVWMYFYFRKPAAASKKNEDAKPAAPDVVITVEGAGVGDIEANARR